jgi:GTP pyrophosphokinase
VIIGRGRYTSFAEAGPVVTTSLLHEIIPGWSFREGATRASTRSCSCAPTGSARRRTAGRRATRRAVRHHCIEVAKILADLQLDSTTVRAGLIHDVVEDTAVELADVEREFGKEIAAIVDGLTKIAKLPNSGSNQDRQVESYRKLLLSIAKDARVIIVKLADRLTTCARSSSARGEAARIALETRDLYAPLAHRFGMAKMRWELEDPRVQASRDEEYKALAKQVAQKRGEREGLIAALKEPLVTRADEGGIKTSKSPAVRSICGRSTRR